MINRIIVCPACGKTIVGERFRYPHEKNITWYKFAPMNPCCPHCDTALKYSAISKVFALSLAITFLVCILLVVCGTIPFYIPPIVVVIFSTIFWHKRSIEIDD